MLYRSIRSSRFSSKCGSLLSTSYRQTGQVQCFSSHRFAHPQWNVCLQGRVVTSSPTANSSRHTVQRSSLVVNASTSLVVSVRLEDPSNKLERIFSLAGGGPCGWVAKRNLRLRMAVNSRLMTSPRKTRICMALMSDSVSKAPAGGSIIDVTDTVPCSV